MAATIEFLSDSWTQAIQDDLNLECFLTIVHAKFICDVIMEKGSVLLEYVLLLTDVFMATLVK